MNQPEPSNSTRDDAIDFTEIFQRVWTGLPLSLGLAFIGLFIATIFYFVAGRFNSTTTTTRVVFSFEGYERGEYPDGSKFRSDDLRSSEIVAQAIASLELDNEKISQSRIRAAISVEGFIPPSIIKERDRLRASGLEVPAFIPDEYAVKLSLPRKFPLSPELRELLLQEIIGAYLTQFQKTYIETPETLGGAMDSLADADYYDYELVLGQESQQLNSFLQQMAMKHKTFRSPETGLSFQDLLKHSQLFTQISLNELLGLIWQHGLSKDRETALLKMDYFLETLEEQEQLLSRQETVLQNLLEQTQQRGQNYVLGVKSASQPNSGETAPLIDQGLIESLLANDAYNFLVREALEIGLQSSDLKVKKANLLKRRERMQEFVNVPSSSQNAITSRLENSLENIRDQYTSLLNQVKATNRDFQMRELGNAVRITMEATTDSIYRELAKAGITGFIVSGALGIGLSLLRIGNKN